MAFIKKLWKDRISQFPNRRTINDGSVTKQVTVGRDEGTITEPGDSFDASNMNDLEQRIEDAYGDVVSLVASEVAVQYHGDVIFDNTPTTSHGVGYAVTSDGLKTALDGKANTSDIPDELNDLSDVNITSPTQGEALVFDADGNIVNGTVSTVGNLDDLSDVDTTGKQEGDSLRYIGNEWKAKPTTVKMTKAEYDAIVDFTPYANTHIVITDAPNLNPTASDIEYTSGVSVADALSNVDTGTLSTTNANISILRSKLIKMPNGIKYISACLQTTGAIGVGETILNLPTGYELVDSSTNFDLVGVTTTGVGIALYVYSGNQVRNNTAMSNGIVFNINSWCR